MVQASRYEVMRRDRKNWKWGVVYACPDDPRLVVRQHLPIGWTWNFSHPMTLPAIVFAVALFIGPPLLALRLGIDSPVALAFLSCAGLGILILAAHFLSKEPATREPR